MRSLHSTLPAWDLAPHHLLIIHKSVSSRRRTRRLVLHLLFVLEYICFHFPLIIDKCVTPASPLQQSFAIFSPFLASFGFGFSSTSHVGFLCIPSTLWYHHTLRSEKDTRIFQFRLRQCSTCTVSALSPKKSSSVDYHIKSTISVSSPSSRRRLSGYFALCAFFFVLHQIMKSHQSSLQHSVPPTSESSSSRLPYCHGLGVVILLLSSYRSISSHRFPRSISVSISSSHKHIMMFIFIDSTYAESYCSSRPRFFFKEQSSTLVSASTRSRRTLVATAEIFDISSFYLCSNFVVTLMKQFLHASFRIRHQHLLPNCQNSSCYFIRYRRAFLLSGLFQHLLAAYCAVSKHRSTVTFLLCPCQLCRPHQSSRPFQSLLPSSKSALQTISLQYRCPRRHLRS